jgi:ectoine hydroxylase-related dioxygenase (phytanoyl-CoA dioxygenase family)
MPTDHGLISAPITPPEATDAFDERGVALYEYVLTRADLEAMDAAFPHLAPRTGGARAEHFSPETRTWFATHTSLLTLAGRLLKAPARLSRMQAFDKSAGANWFVPWHQDRAEDGVERSVAVLERTVALRIHLDDCDENNGPLEVVPGSHLTARLDATAIAERVARASPLLCLAARGDIVAMRPLLIHRSQRARQPAARRVIHLEFTAADLGLDA